MNMCMGIVLRPEASFESQGAGTNRFNNKKERKRNPNMRDSLSDYR